MNTIVGVSLSDIPEWSDFESVRTQIPKKGDTMTGHFLYEDSICIGYAITSLMSGITYTMDFLEVHSDRRKQGIGARILDYVIEHYPEFIVEPVNHSIKLYLRRGAKPVACYGGGIVLVFSQRPASIIKLEVFGEKFCSTPRDDYVYIDDEWDSYEQNM